MKKTHKIMSSILKISKMANNALDSGMRAEQILATKSKDRLSEIKFVKDYEELLDEIMGKVRKELKQ